MKEKKSFDKTKPSNGTPIYPKGYFEQLRQADMLMAEISREKPKQDSLLREKPMLFIALPPRACGKRYALLKALSETNKKGEIK